MAKVDKYNFADAEVDYRAGTMSARAIAEKHGIPEPTLRREAKKRGWVKGLSATKRIMVRDAMAGADLTHKLTRVQVERRQTEAAAQDVEDMNNGLNVARLCVAALIPMIAASDNPRDIKSIVEANKAAVDTIRKIRGLDDLPAEAPENDLSAILAAVNGTSLPIVK